MFALTLGRRFLIRLERIHQLGQILLAGQVLGGQLPVVKWL